MLIETATAIRNATSAIVDKILDDKAQQAHSGIISVSMDEVKFFATAWDYIHKFHSQKQGI